MNENNGTFETPIRREKGLLDQGGLEGGEKGWRRGEWYGRKGNASRKVPGISKVSL